MKNPKAKLFDKEANRLVTRHWDALRWTGYCAHSERAATEAIRRFGVRMYKRGLKDGKE